MPHSQSGEVQAGCYEMLVDALAKGKPEGFQKLARGSGMRMVSPQAAFGMTLEGGGRIVFPLPSPGIASAGAAGEMVELYWQALARDVPFSEYDASPVVTKAIKDLSGFPPFRDPSKMTE